MMDPHFQMTYNEAADGGSDLTAELGADFDDAEERYIHQMLAMLRESYDKAAKPWLDRLATIHAHRPPSPMIVTTAQAEAMGLGFICPRCKVDRLKDPCPDNSLNCPMQAEAQQTPNAK